MTPREHEPIMAEGPSCDIETREERIAGWTYQPRPQMSFTLETLRRMMETLQFEARREPQPKPEGDGSHRWEMSRHDLYFILDENHNVIAEPDQFKWAEWCAMHPHIKDEYISGYRVSTMFLGLNMNLLQIGRPIVFETIVLTPDGEIAEEDRYSTWDEATKGHEAIAARLRNAVIN